MPTARQGISIFKSVNIVFSVSVILDISPNRKNPVITAHTALKSTAPAAASFAAFAVISISSVAVSTAFSTAVFISSVVITAKIEDISIAHSGFVRL